MQLTTVLLAAIVVSTATPAFAGDLTCQPTRIIDGDTLDATCDGTKERIRLLRIDTPERDEPGYSAGTAALEALVRNTHLRLEFETPGTPERGRYGRLLAYVWAGDTFVNTEMVRGGHSEFWTKYGRGRLAEEFEAAEREAQRGTSHSASSSGEVKPRNTGLAARSCIPRSECCKVCSKGKACGNSCIQATSTCRKGRGCACDSFEVCR